MSEELRPCPFCGGKNVLSTELQDGLPFIAYCQCGAENEAENWNTRPIEDALRKRIAELESAQRWTPVSERLPECEKDVLVFWGKALDGSKVDWFGTAWRNDSDDGKWCTDPIVPTHWMPLPEPPNDTQTETFVYGKDSKQIPYEYIDELEAAQARWVMVSERLPNKSGWYRVGVIDVFDEGYTDEAYFGTMLGWRSPVRDEIYCWLDGVPELPQPPEVQQ